MKRVKIFLILFVVAALLGSITYYLKGHVKNIVTKNEVEVRKANDIFIQKALDEFNKSMSIKPSKVAKNLVEELNSKTKNPYDKKNPTYTFDKNCISCTSVEFDDDTRMIILTTYNKKGELTQRTVISPPSFVTYTK